jgi:hypothetical protein
MPSHKGDGDVKEPSVEESVKRPPFSCQGLAMIGLKATSSRLQSSEWSTH